MFAKLEDIERQVFDIENPRVPHIVCKDVPEKLTQDSYVTVYRKQMAVFRYKIYKYLKESGGKSKDPAKMNEQREQFIKISEQRPEFQKASLKLYTIEQKPGDKRPVELMMREAYLDFQTLSLQPDHVGGPYNKRMQVEMKEHNQVLEKMLTDVDDMPNIDKDPLTYQESDLAVDLSQLQGYTLKSTKTFVSRDKQRVQISKGAKDLI